MSNTPVSPFQNIVQQVTHGFQEVEQEAETANTDLNDALENAADEVADLGGAIDDGSVFDSSDDSFAGMNVSEGGDVSDAEGALEDGAEAVPDGF